MTLVPFVLSLRMAERRGLAQARWGAAVLMTSVLGTLVLALALRRGGASAMAGAVVGALLSYAVPLLLRVADVGPLVGGRAGRHE